MHFFDVYRAMNTRGLGCMVVQLGERPGRRFSWRHHKQCSTGRQIMITTFAMAFVRLVGRNNVLSSDLITKKSRSDKRLYDPRLMITPRWAFPYKGFFIIWWKAASQPPFCRTGRASWLSHIPTNTMPFFKLKNKKSSPKKSSSMGSLYKDYGIGQIDHDKGRLIDDADFDQRFKGLW